MILYGTSGIGEPAYGGAIYSADPTPPIGGLGLWPDTFDPLEPRDAPVVELGLTYDPEPQIRTAAIPAWLVLVGVTAWALNKWGGGS